MRLVRGSEVNDFLRCRLRWKYAWMEELKAKRPNGKLFFGNLMHKWLETYYNNLNNHGDLRPAAVIAEGAMADMFQETDTRLMEQTELDELWNLAYEVSNNYHEQWGERDRQMQVIATELTFAIPLDDEVCYTGTIDLIYLLDGKLYFMDHKNVASIDQYVDAAEMDRQISRYWWALEQLARGNGYIWRAAEEKWEHIETCGLYDELKEPSGFVYNLIRKEVPHPPKLLKPTKAKPVALSVAKNQLTTYKLYMQALKEHGLATFDSDNYKCMIPEEYHEILDLLQTLEKPEGNQFFWRQSVVRNEAEVQAAMQEFFAQSKEMRHIREMVTEHSLPLPFDPIYRNITKDCSWDCEFKSLCVASMDGSNVDMIKNLMYEKREEQLTWHNT